MLPFVSTEQLSLSLEPLMATLTTACTILAALTLSRKARPAQPVRVIVQNGSSRQAGSQPALHR